MSSASSRPTTICRAAWALRLMTWMTWAFASMNENVYDCDTRSMLGHGLALRIAS